MFQSTIAADLAGDMMAALKRQKYIDIETGPEPDCPGMVRITAEFSAAAKGTGRMLKNSPAKTRAALESLAFDRETAAAAEKLAGKNAGLRLIDRLREEQAAARALAVDLPTAAALAGPVETHMEPEPVQDCPHGAGPCFEAEKCVNNKVQEDNCPNKPETRPFPSGAAKLTLEMYSKKAGIIRGNTKENLERIWAAAPGCWRTFNPRAKGGPGWFIAAGDVDRFRAALSDLI